MCVLCVYVCIHTYVYIYIYIIRFQVNNSIGTIKLWAFNDNGTSTNPLNSSNWSLSSDQRIKENIVKADLKTCYDNVKNNNLYRYNLIMLLRQHHKDKNVKGYIAQEVRKHFPKATTRNKIRLNDKREVPDLLKYRCRTN